ncbi:MAG: hypothetical protein ACOZQL_38730 [Myxococcota bacterium]
MWGPQRLSTIVVLLGGLALTAVFVMTPPREQQGPFTPRRDDEVVERVARTPRLAAVPLDEAGAVTLATELLAEASRTNDPRLVGRAQAALGAWASSPEPSASLRLVRARLAHQQGLLAHALDELGGNDDVASRELRAELLFSLGRYEASLAACTGVPSLARCEAPARALLGTLDEAALSADGSARALALLARIKHWQGDDAASAKLLTRVLELEELPQARAELAERLLELQRGAEVPALFAGRALSDRELLALVIAGATERAPELNARMEANRQRGDETVTREELCYALLVEHDVARALEGAQRNWSRSHEPEDARWLLEAAAAAKAPAAAQPALEWLAGVKLASPRLRALAKELAP